MARQFAYRAIMADGTVGSGRIEASDGTAALAGLRRQGVRPISVQPVTTAATDRPGGGNARHRAATVTFLTELAALLSAGLALDRSLALAIANVETAALRSELDELLGDVREGAPLSLAMARRPAVFPPSAAAMAEAGEANGALGLALTRLAETLERGEALRKQVGNAMIYPAVLGLLAIAVILMMMLFVVPQFDSLFRQAEDRLPAASRMVMEASTFLRESGWWLLLGLVVAGLALRQILAVPAVQHRRDRLLLHLPQVGRLIRHVECARFARTLGTLVEGDVPLPNALALARRTIGNRPIGEAVAAVAEGVREGQGLATPLASAGIFPPVAIGFMRTGEETSQLGAMLLKLAEVLDRDVGFQLQRLVGIITPLVTVVLGALVAGIIAAVMSAIIGFNDLALTP